MIGPNNKTTSSSGLKTSTQDSKIAWPDLTKDQRAWELAKSAAVQGESLSATIDRAQRIKEAL